MWGHTGTHANLCDAKVSIGLTKINLRGTVLTDTQCQQWGQNPCSFIVESCTDVSLLLHNEQTLTGVVFMGDIYLQALWTDRTVSQWYTTAKSFCWNESQLHARQHTGTGLLFYMHAGSNPKERSSTRERDKPMTLCWLWNMGNHHSAQEKSHLSIKQGHADVAHTGHRD